MKSLHKRKEVGISMRGWWRRKEVVEEGRGKKIESPRVQRSKGLKVKGSHGPKDQDISKSYSNMSLTPKKVHLVLFLFAFRNFSITYPFDW